MVMWIDGRHRVFGWALILMLYVLAQVYVIPDDLPGWMDFGAGVLFCAVAEGLTRVFAYGMGWWKPETTEEAPPDPVWYEPIGKPRRS